MRALHAFALTIATIGVPSIACAQAAPTEMAAPLNEIVGPGIYVSDVERSLSFYRDILGMTVRMKFGPADRPDAVIGYGTEMTRPSLMLLSDRAGPEPRKIEHGHGYDRLAINVADLRGLEARLREAGYTTSEIREVHGAFLMMIATDPDGYRIELLQALPSG